MLKDRYTLKRNSRFIPWEDRDDENGTPHTPMQGLVGTRLAKLEISQGENFLRATTTEGAVYTYSAVGDCCSESWFAEMEGVSNLFTSDIKEIRAVPLENYNTKDGRTRQTVDQAYAFKILTGDGYSLLIFRNSSNGYYGGWVMEIGAEEQDNPFWKKRLKEIRWRNISSDCWEWSA